jgi:HD-GYP domain-containing protein (c-di-GMP phosphodiesterase class II)
MCIPDKILRKPGVFTAFETEIMKMHCLQGYQILWRIPFLKKEAADIVYSHHERFDGTGYPRRLKGKAIPIGARIFAIADALESITTEHTYRPASTISAACEGIKLGSGTQFDPDIVKVFLRVPTSVWKDLRAEIDKQTPPDFPAA